MPALTVRHVQAYGGNYVATVARKEDACRSTVHVSFSALALTAAGCNDDNPMGPGTSANQMTFFVD
jgi:hypothetical protein